MANVKSTTKDSKSKSGKTPFVNRVKTFFKGIRAELKKVIWPDKKRLKQNVGAVLVIILGAALLIFIFDLFVRSFLNTVGFYGRSGTSVPAAQNPPAVTRQIEESAETTKGN